MRKFLTVVLLTCIVGYFAVGCVNRSATDHYILYGSLSSGSADPWPPKVVAVTIGYANCLNVDNDNHAALRGMFYSTYCTDIESRWRKMSSSEKMDLLYRIPLFHPQDPRRPSYH